VPFANCADAVEQLAHLEPDILLLDDNLKDTCGIDCIPAIRDRFPSTKIIMHSNFDDDDKMERSRQPMMAQMHLSELFYVIFAGALVSAILSTVDSALLAASALLSHNVIVSVRPNMTERRKLLISRLGVVAMGAIAYLLALHAEGVYHLVKDASPFGSAGIFVVMLFGLFTRFGGVSSALVTLISGAVVWIVSYYFFEFEWSYLLSLLVALVAYLSVGLVEIAKDYFLERFRQPATD